MDLCEIMKNPDNDGTTDYTDPEIEDDDFIDGPRPVDEFRRTGQAVGR